MTGTIDDEDFVSLTGGRRTSSSGGGTSGVAVELRSTTTRSARWRSSAFPTSGWVARLRDRRTQDGFSPTLADLVAHWTSSGSPSSSGPSASSWSRSCRARLRARCRSSVCSNNFRHGQRPRCLASCTGRRSASSRPTSSASSITCGTSPISRTPQRDAAERGVSLRSLHTEGLDLQIVHYELDWLGRSATRRPGGRGGGATSVRRALPFLHAVVATCGRHRRAVYVVVRRGEGRPCRSRGAAGGTATGGGMTASGVSGASADGPVRVSRCAPDGAVLWVQVRQPARHGWPPRCAPG